MPTEQTEAPRPITLSENTILNGKFYTAGDPLPVERAEDLPEQLRPLVVTAAPEEPDDQPRGSFEPNVAYHVTSEGRLGRQVHRQIARMEAQEEEEQWLEDEASQPLPEDVARDLQDAHEAHVGLQAAQAAAEARRADQIADALIAAQEPPQLFVKRGSRHYVEIHRTKLKPAEPVFTKDADGAYECIGETDSKGSPPDLPIIIP